jgi:hypothetical protein
VGARTDTGGHTAESVEPLLLHKQLDGSKGPWYLPTAGAACATEGPSYWLRAFSAEAAGGEVTGLERYEVVSSEAWRAQP